MADFSKTMPASPKALAQAARAGISPAAVPARRKKIALALAGAADLLQIGMFPVFSQGALAIPDDVLDLVMAVLLIAILGFRWRMVFAMALELVPGAALFPSWTAVVLSLPTIPESPGALPDAKDGPAPLPK
jgi:hypothetical protein